MVTVTNASALFACSNHIDSALNSQQDTRAYQLTTKVNETLDRKMSRSIVTFL